MRSNLSRKAPASGRGFATLAAAFAVLILLAPSGCGLLSSNAEGVAIPPSPTKPTGDLGLGPGVRPLSFGPGDKGSPRISPSGDRVAFVLDGYVIEKPLYAQDARLRTAKGFGAEGAEWLPDESLAILGPADETEEGGAKTASTPRSLFVTRPDDSWSNDSPHVRKFAERVGAAGAVPGAGAVVAALITPPEAGSPGEASSSRLVLLWGSARPVNIYLGRVEGYVTGLSVSPDGTQAVLAVQRATDDTESREASRFEVQVYRFSEGQARHVASVPEGMEVLGAPQWTPQGIHFVAGEVKDPAETPRAGNPSPYALYRVPEGSDAPEPVRGVGENFVAASTNVSPDGERLAMVGRRNTGSPTNLYILDLGSDTLEAATTNENMEIKTNPRDLAWAPDGRSVVLVARGALSGPEVYDAPAETLSSAFYNLYQVPVGDSSGGGPEG